MKQFWRQIQWCVPWLVFVVLIVVVVITISTRAHGQFGGVQQPMFSLISGPATPVSPIDANMAYRWISSDLSNTPVYVWTDRIQGVNLCQTNAGREPTWSSTGVQFTASSTKYLHFTNLVTLDNNFGSGDYDSLLVILRKTQYAGATAVVIDSDSDTSYPDVWIDFNDQWRFGGGAYGPIPGVTNSWLAFLFAGDSGSWTNGTWAGAFDSQSNRWNYVGCNTPAQFFFSGTIREIIVWTNMASTLNPSNYTWVSNVWNYCTNTYVFP